MVHFHRLRVLLLSASRVNSLSHDDGEWSFGSRVQIDLLSGQLFCASRLTIQSEFIVLLAPVNQQYRDGIAYSRAQGPPQ
jgi:hypothetical protein